MTHNTRTYYIYQLKSELINSRYLTRFVYVYRCTAKRLIVDIKPIIVAASYTVEPGEILKHTTEALGRVLYHFDVKYEYTFDGTYPREWIERHIEGLPDYEY